MDRLWSPWRHDYINASSTQPKSDTPSCVFCTLLSDSSDDESKFILHRAEYNFVVLNCIHTLAATCSSYRSRISLNSTPRRKRRPMN